MNKFILTIVVAAFISGCSSKPTTPDIPLALPAQLMELTIEQVHTALRKDQVRCEQLIQGYLDRIEALDQSTGLNAIIQTNAKALERARELDQEWQETRTLKPLHCIPVIAKDNFDTADMPTEAGSIALRGSLPPDDAFMVMRLRQEGAIILAKSNMGEWAFSPYRTISSTHGETRNAYDLTRVPAGSSGGTASAIAANFGIIGLGTDTGNSIRGPAAHLALVGIRSTLGATSRDGIVPLLANRDVGGPLMRTVKDTARVYSLLAGEDPADPLTTLGRGQVRTDYHANLRADGLIGARIGVLRTLSNTDSTDPEVLQVYEKALRDLEASGAELVDPFVIPDFQRLARATGFCSRFRYDLKNYLLTLGDKTPVQSLDEIVQRGLYQPESESAMQWAMEPEVPPQLQNPPCVEVAGDPRRSAFLQAVVQAMDEQKVDVIAYPTWNNPPRLIGDQDSPHGNNSPVIAPHTGQPAITVPMGFAGAGLPLGLQLLARPFEEDKLFQYAFAYEQHTRHRIAPAEFGPLSEH